MTLSTNPVTDPVTKPILHALHGWPPALTTLALIASALISAAVFYLILTHIIPKRMLAHRPSIAGFIARSKTLLGLILLDLCLAGIIPATTLSPGTQTIALRLLSAAFIALLGTGSIIALDVITSEKLAHRPDDIQANVIARRHATQWQVLRRVSLMLGIIITIAATLMVFPAVRQYGVSLLASAGAAALVVGLAARPVLSNLIAGIQIAITQPFRVEDAVVIDGQWGWIEDITATYVVVRIWNWQRMVVPLAWLLQNPFQNWTRESAELIGTVHWSVDYTVPVEKLRAKLSDIVQSTKLWSGKVVVLQVTHALATSITLRALVSARNSGEAWDLRCYVREKMIDYLQSEYPGALPKHRIDVESQELASTITSPHDNVDIPV
ncbi:MAG TPA: mechanosensitive ion channel family protein [Acidiphilium sp.]|nr:MAG: mechanosensitive ion channel protein MscS [Acidiphilium sp. 21-60-14]OYV90838.1 MAG: mechanosensitive ion channel protein MscS [Acidiphilium sp. 37-60-79]OZB38767.1 MAG: mechanosensitive ion channel protein MscS [Acidiphilium sp. 34-60-192]HQT86953.1 mechanosensitive ion channel family protein [Acidiphilium sp.]HQU24095.1 mechanosensitive ion channel family protein [Acidiphilium sp.]